jgi:hypothetical protein
MLDRRIFLKLFSMALAAGPAFVLRGADATLTASEAALQYWEILREQGLPGLIGGLQREEAERFRRMITFLAENASGDSVDEPLACFGVASIAELKRLDDGEFFSHLWSAMLGQSPEMQGALKRTTLQIVGSIPEGPDRTHVVYRYESSHPDDALLCLRPQMVSLRQVGNLWQLLPKSELQGLEAAIKAPGFDLTPTHQRSELIGQLNLHEEVLAIVRYSARCGPLQQRGNLLLAWWPLHGSLYEAGHSGDRKSFEAKIQAYFQGLEPSS